MASTKHTSPVFKQNVPDDSYKFKPLPAPTGNYPYHLNLSTIVTDTDPNKLVFQMVGDTGGNRNPGGQLMVATAMADQYTTEPADQPKFLYHLGDIVYHYGEAEHYNQQFFTPFKNHPGPIFAIAGNHDSDINPDSPVPYQSLDAFTTVFCDTEQRYIPFDTEKSRKSMVQPNIFWTLESPLVSIIGLHSNVPKFGVVTAEQRAWFVEELIRINANRPGKALIVCIHHAPYSADTNHGSSRQMIHFLEDVFKETNIKPDAVFSGHVHNYQRFTKTYADGICVPYIVAGAGGFDELHDLALTNDPRFTADDVLFDGVKLDAYFEHKHGFLKLTIKKTPQGVTLSGDYYIVYDNMVSIADSFCKHI